jgi:hypothetical protein
MDGIQIIRLLDFLKVNSIRNAPGVSPRSIIVKGDDFRNVEQVIMDGFAAPEFVVYSTTELVAEVPSPLRDSVITSVSVLSSSLTLTERSIVEFTFGTRPKKVRGVLRLMQTFLRILLRTPGSNRFHPRSGGGLLKQVSGLATQQTAADIAIAVQSAKQYLINVQTAERNIPPSERLLSAEIQALNVDPRSTSAFVTIVLTSHSGLRGAATITT